MSGHCIVRFTTQMQDKPSNSLKSAEGRPEGQGRRSDYLEKRGYRKVKVRKLLHRSEFWACISFNVN